MPVIDRIVNEAGETVSTLTQEELNRVQYTYSLGTSTLTGAPVNRGTYYVSAEINGTEFHAITGALKDFTISPKQLTVARIEKYLTYVTAEELKALEKAPEIKNPGMILLNGVVGADQVSVTATKVSYNDTTIGYGAKKITLEGVTLSGKDKDNYSIASTQTVFGQISYRLNDAIFRKPDGSTVWDKFYPVDSPDPVTTPDDHSPYYPVDNVFHSHVDFVYARTEGEGESGKVVALDVVFGNMQFIYTEKVWNPTTMEYEESPNQQSYWVGFDGANNSVTVINRSNREVSCSVSATIDYLHGSHGDSTHGIRAGVYETNADTVTTADDVSGTPRTVAAATPGDETKYGTVGEKTFYIRLSGIPALDEGTSYTPVGRLTLTFSQ